MKRVIYKYPLALIEETGVPMPRGAIVRSVQVQANCICIWAEVDPKAKPEVREFRIVGTGQEIPQAPFYLYLATVQMDGFVWHVYEAQR